MQTDMDGMTQCVEYKRLQTAHALDQDTQNGVMSFDDNGFSVEIMLKQMEVVEGMWHGLGRPWRQKHPR